MTRVSLAALVAAALVAGALPLTGAEGVRFRHLVSIYGPDGGGLNRPEGVACNDKGELVIGDTGNDRLLRFTYRNRALAGGAAITIAELSAPTRVQMNSAGDIYALDGKQRRIVRLNPEGTFKGMLSFDGAPPPATIVPKSFAIDAADRVYVLDTFSARILVLDAGGTFQRAIALPSEAGFITDVSIDATGNVVVLDAIGRRLYSAARDASAFAQLGGDLTDSLVTLPTALLAHRGVIFVVEGSVGSIASFGQDGVFLTRQLTRGGSEGALNHPAQLCLNGNDEAFIADRDNSRVQVFALSR